MPDDDALVELAARAEYVCVMTYEESDDFDPITWEDSLSSVKDHYRRRARAVLSALRDAGALPTGVEWGYRCPAKDPLYCGDEHPQRDEQTARFLAKGRTLICRPVGQWVEVPTDG